VEDVAVAFVSRLMEPLQYNEPRQLANRPRTRQDCLTMHTTIGKLITITGTIHAQEPVTIAGTVTGDVLASDHDVTIEVGAYVEGAVTARNITIHGRSTGRLIAREVVRLHDSASVKADVAAPKLALEDGALFNGCVEPAKAEAARIVTAYRNSRAEGSARSI
jgi:cytoskeletal protein CcmA (bactofilin family)